jgi:hypothetical protein
MVGLAMWIGLAIGLAISAVLQARRPELSRIEALRRLVGK